MKSKNLHYTLNFKSDAVEILKLIAKKEHIKIPTLINNLILEALDIREDKVLSHLADQRLKNKVILLSHEETWDNLLKK